MPYLKSLYPSPPLSTPTQNYHDFIVNRDELKQYPDYTVHIDAVTGERRRLRAVLERIGQAATALSSSKDVGGLGIRAGQSDIVGILSENSLEYPILVFALLKIAVPVALLPSQGTVHETAALLKLSSITALFVSARLYTRAKDAASEAGIPEDKVIILQGDVEGKASLPRLIENVRTRGLPSVPSEPVKDDTLAYMVFSSGTTGIPKAVMISHRNLYFSAVQMMITGAEAAKVFTPPPFPTPEKIPVSLGVLPWYHTMGAHIFIFRLLLVPATAVVLPYWSVDLVAKVFSQLTITHFSLVPAMLYQMMNHPVLAKLDLSSMLFAHSGAAFLPPELRDAFHRRTPNAPHFGEGFGMSECTLAAIQLAWPGSLGGRAERVRGMTGLLLPSMEARIVREDGTDADYDEAGELWLRGPNVGLGYWKNEKATRETFKDGWLHTGDRFYVDKEQRFFYVDRIKDILKVSGKQVAPSEIENVILEHPSQLVSDVAVAGVKGGRLSDEFVPRAWVVLSSVGKQQGAERVLAELEEWTRTRLSRYKWLRGGLQVVDEIPKLPTGKVLRRKLQEEFAKNDPENALKAKL
ncbi:acetyl-CoA synthetase-like protein [Gloeopeniophorella convolvens]|nr:acetyl-CoA synthetase-like protein [Gloeopeniophorella convolvens]